jgi:hypothetical protein
MMSIAKWMTAVLLLAGSAWSGCGGSTDRPTDRLTDSPTPKPTTSPTSSPTDSLVLQAPGGITVWFTAARTAKDSSGTSCLERALEIRHDSVKAGVPLLYTREAPTLLDSTAMRAVLYNQCHPGPAYRVDFATVSPKRLPR